MAGVLQAMEVDVMVSMLQIQLMVCPMKTKVCCAVVSKLVPVMVMSEPPLMLPVAGLTDVIVTL